MDAVPYWPFYCEENVWQQCAALPERARRSVVAFISNPARTVAVWQQRAAETVDGPIVWDYHVIQLVRHGADWSVVDRDSRLPQPIAAGVYLDQSFPRQAALDPELRPMFRLVEAAEYRSALRSDRSHMRVDGGWARPPPPWPCIGQEPDAGTNLMQFVDVQAKFLGEVVDLPGLRQWLDRPAAL